MSTGDASRRTTIVIADDHPIVRDALAAIIRMESDLEVVDHAGDGVEALDRILARRPSVAVLDVGMPNLSGIEVARRLRDAGVATAVVMISGHEDARIVREALSAGARGSVGKTSAPAELVAAIRAVSAGGSYVSEALRRALALEPERKTPLPSSLSPREREILAMIARGLPSKEIALRLDIDLRTVNGHRARMLQRLGIESLAGLIRYALDHGLAESGPASKPSSEADGADARRRT
jgi:DNA-binding NarL/FixJ family response regulator